MKDITVVVLTYNPNYKDIIKTINSIIFQKNVSFDLIISDDGSKFDYFEDIEKHLIKEKFNNYKFIKNKNNAGTVKNIHNALQNVDTKFVKIIGQGDMFYSELSLYELVKESLISNCDVLFSDSIYYSCINDDIVLYKKKNHPQTKKIYNNNDYNKHKKYYLIFNDIFLGASVLYKTEEAKKYISYINNKVIYADDNIIRLMVLDDKKMHYLNKNEIMYEYGTGISTNNNQNNRLLNDWNSTNILISKSCMKKPSNTINKRILYNIGYSNNKNHTLIEKIEYRIKNIDLYFFKFRRKLFPCKTKKEYDKIFMSSCLKKTDER